MDTDTKVNAILYEKQRPNARIGRARAAPLPRNRDDVEFYKIAMVQVDNNHAIAELNLNPVACSRLLKLSERDLKIKKSAVMTLQEIMSSKAMPNYDPSQIELMKKSSSYENNRYRWARILKNIVFSMSDKQIRFDTWKLIQSYEDGEAMIGSHSRMESNTKMINSYNT